MFSPIEINGKWFAEYEVTEYFTNKKKMIIFTDLNGDDLWLVNEEYAKGWCYARNEINKIF